LKVRPIGCFERSATNNQSTRRNTAEELRHFQAYFLYRKLQILLGEITVILYH